jgi:hypothetical protein
MTLLTRRSLYTETEKKEAQLEKPDAQIAVKQTKAATLAEIDAMGHALPFVPGVHLSDGEAKHLKALARQTVKTDERIAKSKRDMAAVKTQLAETEQKLRDVSAERDHWHREWQGLWDEVKPFIEAIRKFPAKMLEFVKSLFPQIHTREKEQEISSPPEQSTNKKSYGMEI